MATTAFGLSTAAGCGSDGDGSATAQSPRTVEVAGKCIFAVDYHGHRYVGNAAPVKPVEGDPLGSATQPACQDTPDAPKPEDTEIEVAEIQGVSPDLAITMQGADDTILIRDDVDVERLPAELARLLRAPR